MVFLKRSKGCYQQPPPLANASDLYAPGNAWINFNDCLYFIRPGLYP